MSHGRLVIGHASDAELAAVQHAAGRGSLLLHAWRRSSAAPTAATATTTAAEAGSAVRVSGDQLVTVWARDVTPALSTTAAERDGAELLAAAERLAHAAPRSLSRGLHPLWTLWQRLHPSYKKLRVSSADVAAALFPSSSSSSDSGWLASALGRAAVARVAAHRVLAHDKLLFARAEPLKGFRYAPRANAPALRQHLTPPQRPVPCDLAAAAVRRLCSLAATATAAAATTAALGHLCL